MSHANHDAPPPMDPLSAATAAALMPVLERGEHVERTALAVGCSLILTDRRLLLIRDGAVFRPRSGIRSWPIDGRLRVQLESGIHDPTMLSITRDGKSANVFLIATRTGEVRRLIASLRQRIRTTRSASAEGPSGTG
jgi:hypothetical protein